MKEQEIILSQIASIYDSPPFVKYQDGQMKMILRCCGLGEYYDQYSEYLEPHYYNGVYRNENLSYRIFLGLDYIFSDLINIDAQDKLISLLTELGTHIGPAVFVDEELYQDKFNRLNNLYNLLGLKIEVKEIDIYGYEFKVIAHTCQSERLSDDFGMEKWLKNEYPAVYTSYKSALESYAIGNIVAAVESCRSSLTGIFSQFKGIPFKSAKWILGLATETGDFVGETEEDISQMQPIKNAIEQHGRKDIADFFGDNLEGSFKKTKAIYSIYSMLSDYGTHSQEGTPETLNYDDALMMLRMTTDILVWVYQKNTI